MAYVKTLAYKTMSSLKNLLSYITKESKTNENIVSTHLCHLNPDTAAQDFYRVDHLKGKGKDTCYYARHIIQSFSPEDQVTPEKAHEIGKKYMEALGYTSYQYYIATHTDRGHIHNHIVFNPTNFFNGRQYQSNLKELKRLRSVSDELCKNYKLSVIKPNLSAQKMSRYEWSEWRKQTFYKAKIKSIIDNSLSFSRSYDDFLAKIKAAGLSFDDTKMHFKVKDNVHKRWFRLDRLGLEYDSKAAIADKINKKNSEKIQLLKGVDYNKYNSSGWHRFAALENLKAMNRSINYAYSNRSLLSSKASIKANKDEMTKIRLEILDLKDKRADIEIALKSKALLNDNNELINEYNSCSDKESFAASHPYFYDVINAYKNIKEIAAKWNDGKLLTTSGWEQLAIENDQKISSLYLKLSEKKVIDKDLQLALKVLTENNININKLMCR